LIQRQKGSILRSKALLIFAHRGEAGHFFKVYPYRKPVKEIPGLYESDNHLILITGEGGENVKISLQTVLNLRQLDIAEIINMGIAGALNPKLDLNEPYEIRYVLKIKDEEELESESFDIESESALKCITADKPISSSAEAIRLSEIGDIVDMEAWYIAKVAAFHDKQIRVIKLISDYPGVPNPGNMVEQAPRYSHMLYKYYESHIN